MPTRTHERRIQRSSETLTALELQLEACRHAAGLDGMVLADRDGLLLAAVGCRNACDEIGARLPVIGQRVADFEGVLLVADGGWTVRMRRFQVGLGELYLAAIGRGNARRDDELSRGEGGVARILA